MSLPRRSAAGWDSPPYVCRPTFADGGLGQPALPCRPTLAAPSLRLNFMDCIPSDKRADSVADHFNPLTFNCFRQIPKAVERCLLEIISSGKGEL